MADDAASLLRRRPRRGLRDAARQDRRQRRGPLRHRHHLAVLRAPAPRGSGALRAESRVRPLLVGDQVRRHHHGRDQPSGVLVRENRIGDRRPTTSRPNDFELPMFIAMDPPKHDAAAQDHRADRLAARTCANMAPLIRERAGKILDELPIGEPFDWVDRVSVELTTQMLATLFDFPFEERRKLTYWSDLATTDLSADHDPGSEARAELMACAFYFKNLWDERVERAADERPDLHAGARRGDQGHAADGVPRQHPAADRRRQRHHPQLDHRRPAGAEREPRPVRQAARQSRR